MTASRHALGTRALISDLTGMATTGESLDEATLREMCALIVDPKGTGEARGLQGREFTLEQLSRRIFLQALAAELDLAGLPDPFWELARVGLLLVRQRYQRAQLEWESAADAVYKCCLPRVSMCALLDPLCFLLLYLLTILQRGPHPRLQENLQPHAWMTSAVRVSIKAEPVPTSLLLPNGLPILRLQIEVALWHKGIPWSFSFALPYL